MEIKEAKKILRKEIAVIKKNYSMERRSELSETILKKMEALPAFESCTTILLYHALPDEVQTLTLLNRWCESKRLVLPVVDGDNLLLRRYLPQNVEVGYCSILEPVDTEIVPPKEIELAIIPGVAFDAKCNRLGRGRGFYDRLLPDLSCEIVGLGFDFQLVDEIPVEPFDRRLSMVITESCSYTEK